jgi:saccharopine dehydrogenase (NAD+, L-lysine-forming)
MAKASEFEEIVKGHELLVNAATPRLNKFLMDICLKHGLNYIDLASDDLRQQLSQHTRWRRKGLKALICLGEDPGLSNIYVKLAAGRLKNIVAVKVRDGEFSKSRKIRYCSSLFTSGFLWRTSEPCLRLRKTADIDVCRR